MPAYYYEDLKKDFGATVAGIVQDLSEDKDSNVESDDKATWEERKKKYLKDLEHHNKSALMVCAADKIHNLQTMIDAYEEQGEALWEKFNAPSDKKLWFYEEILKVLKRAGLEDRIVNDCQHKLTRMRARLSEKINSPSLLSSCRSCACCVLNQIKTTFLRLEIWYIH